MKYEILKMVADYYTQKVDRYGTIPPGVDWNSKESQYLRFEQLCRVIKSFSGYSLLDYGCGYGELAHYLIRLKEKNDCNYWGYDISDKMIESAVLLHGHLVNTSFSKTLPQSNFDYAVASGVLNVKLNLPDEEWLSYILSTLQILNNKTEKGFSFNALTKYSDEEQKKDYLYYSDPLFLFDYCKRHFSKNVSLLHDYDLYEFTIIVRK